MEDVKVGDWVVVSCQARGGNPIPDIDLKMDDDSFSAKDTMQFKNTFTFQATEDMNGKTVQCSASNKMGDSEAEKTLTILSKFLQNNLLPHLNACCVINVPMYQWVGLFY